MKKIVLKLDLHGDKNKQKVMKRVSAISGVESIAMDMKEKNLTVTGDIDPVKIVAKLRKLCHTEILTVGPTQEPTEERKDNSKKAEPKKEDQKKAEPKRDEQKKQEAQKQEPKSDPSNNNKNNNNQNSKQQQPKAMAQHQAQSNTQLQAQSPYPLINIQYYHHQAHYAPPIPMQPYYQPQVNNCAAPLPVTSYYNYHGRSTEEDTNSCVIC